MREITDRIKESNANIAGVTLGRVCAAGMVFLDVSCHAFARRGRYRVTRLIDRHRAAMMPPELKDLLSA
jgi:hypothetical protein